MEVPKKFLTATTAFVLILVLLAGCGGNSNNVTSTDGNTAQPEQNAPVQTSPATGEAVHTNWGDFGITIQYDEVRIRNWSGDATGLIIPAEIDGLPVTEIGHNSFSVHGDYMSQLTSLIIPDSVRRIENFAFANVQLESLVLGNNVEYIGNSAFARNALLALVIPDSVVHIGSSAFIGNDNLESLTIGSGVTHIGAQAFNETRLTSLFVPDNVQYIGARAFGGSHLLSTITIGSGVEYIGDNAFHSAFRASVEMLTEVAHIGENAFNQQATIVFINRQEEATPESYEPDTIPLPLENIYNGFTFVVDGGEVTIIGYIGTTTDLIIPERVNGFPVTAIGAYAMQGLSGTLQSITIPDSVTHIGNNAFAGLYMLNSITMGTGVTHIGDRAFADCSWQLITIDLPVGLLHIGNYAFANTQLHYVNIPHTVISVGENILTTSTMVRFRGISYFSNDSGIPTEFYDAVAANSAFEFDNALVGRWRLLSTPPINLLDMTPFEQEMWNATQGLQIQILEFNSAGVGSFSFYVAIGARMQIVDMYWNTNGNNLTISHDFLWGHTMWEYSINGSLLSWLDQHGGEWVLERATPGYVERWQQTLAQEASQIPYELLGTWAERRNSGDVITFFADGTMLVSALASPADMRHGTFAVHNDLIVYASGDVGENFVTILRFSVDGNTLRLQDLMQGNPMVYYDRHNP